MSEAINQNDLQHAVDLVFFEQWLRFYFIVEEDGKLFIRVPGHEMETARLFYPQLYPVADALNNCEIDHQSAMNAMCENLLGGPFAMSGQQWAKVLSGEDFKLTLQLMSFWVQAEEDGLGGEAMSFHAWRERFKAWRESPVIREYTARLASGSYTAESRVQ